LIKINDILKLSNCKIINKKNKTLSNFSGCSIDSRKIKGSELFVAIKGETNDGHEYIPGVILKKVKAAIVNKSWYARNREKNYNIVFFVVNDTLKSLGELANIHKNNYNIPIICIGGSNGKTTTKDITGQILKHRYNVLVTEGNYNNHIGLPLTLLKLNKKHQICILEVGSNHFNEIKYLCEISEPNFGLVTNIGREHLEFFKNLKGVAKEEFQLYDYLLNDSRGSICFANYDDKYVRNYFRAKIKADKNRVFSYSYNFNSDLKGRFVGFDRSFNPEIEIVYLKEKFKCRIPTFGIHSVYNGLAAASIALYIGMKGLEIKKAFMKFKPSSSKRMEIKKKKGILIINDTYNSNPDSVKMGLETIMKYSSKGKKHIVLSDMLEMGEASAQEHKNVGKLIRKMSFENLYTYGKESYNTFLSAGNIKNNYYFDERDSLSRFLTTVVKKGDLVYVKGSRGMKMEYIVEKLIN